MSDWITLAIPASSAASIAVKVAGTIALGYLGTQAIDYLADKAFAPDPVTGDLKKQSAPTTQLQLTDPSKFVWANFN